MKKKDLKIGEVYADKRGNAFLLVSTQIWSYERYSQEWRVSRFTTPVASQGYMSSGRGVLCLSGSAEQLRAWARGNSELLGHGSSEFSSRGDAEEFITQIRESLPAGGNFRITQEDYRQWPGTYASVRAELDKKDKAREAEGEKLRAVAAERRERAEAIRAELSKRGVVGKLQTSHLPGVYNQYVYAASAFQFDLTELEKLLGINSSEEN